MSKNKQRGEHSTHLAKEFLVQRHFYYKFPSNFILYPETLWAIFLVTINVGFPFFCISIYYAHVRPAI